MESHNEIYIKIISEIDKLIKSINKSDNDQKIHHYKTKTISKLTTLHNNLTENLSSLQENADWDTFTIAFYGETNAGKSTLIETLRIILNEPTKAIERANYAKATEEYNNLTCHLDELNKKKECIKSNAINKHQKYLEEIQNLDDSINQIEDAWLEKQIRQFYLNQEIINYMVSSITGFFKVSFSKTPKQKESKNLTLEIENIKKIHNANINKLNDIKSQIHFSLANNDLKYESVQKEIKLTKELIKNNQQILKDNSDGRIINANTDFTKEMQIYQFQYDGINFNILDLPGIEGKEENVIDEIEKAVQKAHVVFYISRKAHSPQSGGDNNNGTIDKIQKQLSKQTEVYFIYNKSVTNPRHLKNKLVSDDEVNSLVEADQQMIKVLGNNYVRHISLSAKPAFIALCNDTSESTKKTKDKFLKTYTKNEILDMSNVSLFGKWIGEDLIQEYKRKIIKSNFKKIKSLISDTNSNIDILLAECIELDKKIKIDFDNIKIQIEEVSDQLKRNVESLISIEIQNYIKTVRNQMYKEADKNISNKELEKVFKDVFTQNKKKFEKNLDKNIKYICDEYRDDITKIINRYNQYLNDLTAPFLKKNNIDLTTDIKINAKGKGRIAGVIISLGTIIFGIISAPEGGIILVIVGIINGLISLGKEILGFFDKNYKIGQQKKCINTNLEKIEKELNSELNNNIQSINKEISEISKHIISELSQSTKTISTIIKNFKSSKNHLDELKNNITKEEKVYYENN